MAGTATLFVFCGKMAAGKTTLSIAIAEREQAVRLVQDDWLARLHPGEILDVADYIRCSRRLNEAMQPLICALLARGIPVVLDFPGNTKSQRAWFRRLIDASGASHELHFIDAPDDVCKRQLRARSAGLPTGTPWTTDAEFDAITVLFEPPAPDEGFNVVRHVR